MLFSIKKLENMSLVKRAEKGAVILLAAEKELSGGKTIDVTYIRQIIHLICRDMESGKRDLLLSFAGALPAMPGREDARTVENMRHLLLSLAGKEPAEWDLHCFSFDSGERSSREILPINVFLDDLRSPFNVGSVFRTAESFCYENVFISGSTPDPGHSRALRSSMGTTSLVNWKKASVADLPGPLFALETGGTAIGDFHFPERGTVIIGSEESGISPDAVKAVTGIVSIPLYGIKGSINVGVAFGILSYCWVNSIRERGQL